MLKTGGDIGYNVDGDLVLYFAFADNLVVLVRSIVSLGKCSTMTVVCNRKLKKWAVDA